MRPIDDSNILIIAEWKNRESYTNIREYETKKHEWTQDYLQNYGDNQ